MSEIIMNGTNYRGGLVKSTLKHCKECDEYSDFVFEKAISKSEAAGLTTECQKCGKPYNSNVVRPKRGWIYESVAGNHFDPVTEAKKVNKIIDERNRRSEIEEAYTRGNKNEPIRVYQTR